MAYDSRFTILRYSSVHIMQLDIVGMASSIPLIVLSDSGDEIPPAPPVLPIPIIDLDPPTPPLSHPQIPT